MRDTWESGGFSAAFDTEMIVKNAGATGACSILKEIVEIDAYALFGESDE